MFAGYRLRGLAGRTKALAIRVLFPDQVLVRQVVQESVQLRKSGDLRGALAIYDGLPDHLREDPEAQAGRERAAQVLTKHAHKQAQRLRYDGRLAQALDVYDALPAALRDRPDVAHERASVHHLMRKQADKARRRHDAMCKQARKEVRRLRRAGDLAGAIAYVDALPAEVRELAEIHQARNEVIEALAASAPKKLRQLRRAGDLVGALAFFEPLPREVRELADICQARNEAVEALVSAAKKKCHRLRRAGDIEGALAELDRLPPALRERADVLHERAYLVHQTGHLQAAADLYWSAIAADPSARYAWRHLGAVLTDLGRMDELREHIGEMVSKHPDFEGLFQGAQIARAAKLPQLAETLLGKAILARATATPAALVKAAQVLLEQGDQGRAIAVLDSEPIRSDAAVQALARDLEGAALAQLRLAGGSCVYHPIDEATRADVIAVRSILGRRGDVAAAPPAPARGIAIVVSSLGAGGAQRQTAELVVQMCRLYREFVGPIVLLAVSRSESGAEFHAGKLADLDVAIEFVSDFAVDAGQLVPDVAARLGVLHPKHHRQTIGLVGRFRVHRPEVVVAMGDHLGISAMLAAALTGVPRVVVSARNVPPPQRYADDLLQPAYRCAVADGHVSLVTNSAATARAFAAWLGDISAPIGVIHNGVDANALAARRDPNVAAAHRRALGISDSARIVGSIFQGRRQKRPHLWIEAAGLIARRAPDVVFVLVGDMLNREDIHAALVRYGLEHRVHRPGIRSDAANWLELMDVVLLTSAYEGTPNVLLEAQALGRPVVATAVGGCAESFLPDETGLLVSASSTPEEIADAVLRVLDDPGFAERASTQAPAFIRQRFNPQRMASEYVDLCFSPRATSMRLAASA
jgi:glycosyltransferase involved in cell wall biosynthesis/tetratricopeptide (TPR) repeat protein